MLLGPESPRWLASRHRDHEAELAARRLWGPLGPAELGSSRPAAVATAAANTGRVAAADVDSSSSGMAVAPQGGLALLSGPAARPLLIGVMLFAFQQFAGINALVYFSSSVFRQVGPWGGEGSPARWAGRDESLPQLRRLRVHIEPAGMGSKALNFGLDM
ncbi:hypothetical protein Vretifemale_19933 [Volvox reticuliferus]|uniref:Major facilitator superfamily (MFS) profile domain-containing protein n=1 Tax=Volvox reticuliferus TaxID=1737510 RepID=A0A8J4CYY0_9CHLO|nr:hypothetical protein Vretifemale_19933 [Volvox reticuliferus]